MTASNFKKTVGLIALVVILSACDKAEISVFNTRPLQEKVNLLENKVSILEAQIAQISAKPVSSETWVLWTRLDWLPGSAPINAAGPVPFKPISAFENRTECMKGANDAVAAGSSNGRYVTRDPLVVDYPDGRREFACLPKGVDAGYHYR